MIIKNTSLLQECHFKSNHTSPTKSKPTTTVAVGVVVGKRASDDSANDKRQVPASINLECSECCKGDLCNAQGCGISGTLQLWWLLSLKHCHDVTLLHFHMNMILLIHCRLILSMRSFVCLNSRGNISNCPFLQEWIARRGCVEVANRTVDREIRVRFPAYPRVNPLMARRLNTSYEVQVPASG